MLNSHLFSNNPRLIAAAVNNPAMRRGDPDQEAVRLLQLALKFLQVATMRMSTAANGTLDGDYGGETFRAVQSFQRENSLGGANNTFDGIANSDTLEVMDAQLIQRGNPTRDTLATRPPGSRTPLSQNLIPKRPTASRLQHEYNKFVDVRGKPCACTGQNQCAVRMTVALGRSDIGFHLNGPSPRRLYVHRAFSRRCGGVDTAHDNSAGRVFRYLQTFWPFTRYNITQARSGADIYTQVQGPPAIIFFERLAGNRDSSRLGNHIDFFDGTRIMNDALGYATRGEPSPGPADGTFKKTLNAIYVMPLMP